jgi:hypothetical protein
MFARGGFEKSGDSDVCDENGHGKDEDFESVDSVHDVGRTGAKRESSGGRTVVVERAHRLARDLMADGVDLSAPSQAGEGETAVRYGGRSATERRRALKTVLVACGPRRWFITF